MSQRSKPLQGVVVPMITPLTESGGIDAQGVERLCEFLIAGGVDALFALGSSGEFVSLPWPSQLCLLRAAVRAAAGRVPVCAGVSSNCLDEVAERAQAAAAAGADYAVALPPFYFRHSQAELIRFFAHIADLSPIPLVLYNMPFRTNQSIEPASVEELSAHPNIAGIKDTVSDMARTLDVLARLAGRPDFAYLHGNELLALPAMLYGAAGMVPSLANFAPSVMVEAGAAARRGDREAMLVWQRRIQGLMRVFTLFEARPQDSTTLRLQAIKGVLREMGICGDRMAQLDERPDETRRALVREFAAAEHLSLPALWPDPA